jgi:hypothetical protein
MDAMSWGKRNKGLRVVLCENGFISQQGHHFNLVVGVTAELARRGVPLIVLSHLGLGPLLRAELAATPVFEQSPYTSLMAIDRGSVLKPWWNAGSKFAEGLARIVIGPDDVLLVLTARPAEVLGLARWSWTRRRRPRAIVLNFMTDDFRPGRTSAPPALTRLLYRVPLGLLKLRVGRGRLQLTSASESLASTLEGHLRERVSVSPVLHSYPEAPVRGVGKSPVIGFLGTPREDKGESLLAAIIESCAAWLPDARVVAQVPPGFRAPVRGWRENVQVMPVGLGREEYFGLLSRLDLVVLPYRSDLFGDMVSGVFTDAVAQGAVTVVPANTWMATMIERGRAAGVMFETFDVAAIVGAIAIAEDRLDDLRPRAAALQGPWCAEQSISAYFDQLFADLGTATRVSSTQNDLRRRGTSQS